jgi:hypothetical protein
MEAMVYKIVVKFGCKSCIGTLKIHQTTRKFIKK